MHNGIWAWPTGRRRTMEIDIMIQHIPEELKRNKNVEDQYKWELEKSGYLTVKSVIERLRGTRVVVS